MSTYRDARRDQAVAEDAGISRSLMCGAYGCPNRWSVDPPRMCSAHAWAEPHQWPSITQQQIDAETQRAIASSGPKESQRFVTPDPAKLRRYLTRLAQGIRDQQRTPRGWAERLREREEAGERLTPAQKEAWRSVHGVLPEVAL